MKTLRTTAMGIMATALCLFTSCVEDETHDADTEINVVNIENIEDSYTALSNIDRVVIEPKVTGSLYGEDESNYRYVWTVNVSKTVGEVENKVISTEKNLDYFVTDEPGSYTFTFRVYDKTNGMEYEKSTVIRSSTPFVRGYYLYGAKPDGTVGMDFVSFVGNDTTIVRDVFKNDRNLKNPKDLIFMGYYYNDFLVNLWATTEDGYAELESSPQIASIGCLDTEIDKMCYPTLESVKRPMKFVDMYPHAAQNTTNSLNSRTRVLVTENELFSNIFYSGPEMYGNPFNRYSTAGEDAERLFKPAPYVFYVPSAGASISSFVFFDMTNHCFCGTFGVVSAQSTCVHFDPSSDVAPEGSFYWNQDKYSPVRDLVYGYNSMNKRSYALMNDSNGKYYVYQFQVGGRASSCQKIGGYTIDMDKATDLAKASHYAFFSAQPYLLYSVGSKLYVLNYAGNKCEMVKDFGDEITYLAMDISSANKYTDFRVCTYSETNKGNVYKYQIEDDVNAIKVAATDEQWKTDLRVVKFEYRNSSYGKKKYE